PDQYSNDAPSHIRYIEYVALHLRIPRADQDWLAYHPPLYYLLTGILYRLAHPYTDAIPVLRAFSLVCHLIFLLCGAATLRLFITDRALYLLASGMLAAWPSGVMSAARIDSAALLYPLAAASFYYLVQWHRKQEREMLAACLIAAGFAVITRSNAFILLISVAIAAGFHLLRRTVAPGYFARRCFALTLILLIMTLGINMGRPIYLRLAEHKQQDLVVGNRDAMMGHQGLRVSNAPRNFTRFATETYFNTPFFSVGEDRSGRQNFWVTLLKSSLFGEFSFRQAHLAFGLTVALLGFVAFMALPPIFYTPARFMAAFPCVVVIASAVAGLMYNRWHVPVSPSADFRYIYFTIIPLIALFGYHLQWMKESRQFWFLAAGWIIATAMILLSLGVYIGEFWDKDILPH
ncbi:MAG: glycosyltransferase family 39 protein, partial [Alphaproteobacteria bacterium]|nr:glycosyltransferase family 39 protein [Alphaproteobacteria bacterium]